MDEEDDDFYAPNGDAQVKSEDAVVKNEHSNGNAAIQDEDMDVLDHADNDGDDDDEEDDDDDSDIDIITERQDGAAPEPPPQVRPFRPIKPELPRTASVDAPASISTPRTQQPPAAKLDQPTQAKKVSGPLKDDSKYPEVRSSSIDVNAIPTWSPVGKPITQVDVDTDLAEHAKPWRLPGTDQTDYFNYGFDEFTWTQYCLRQPAMASVINGQKQEHKQLEMMFNPTGPGPQPGAMNMGMAGMPDPETMSAMMAQMQGVADPSQLDFGTFMQQMQSMGSMPGGPGGPQYGTQSMQQQSSNQGYGGQQNYPHQQQQGAQGYGGGTPQPQTQGQQPSFEGYSAQQLAMMQGQGGGGPPQGPAGGARGRGRGRGRHW